MFPDLSFVNVPPSVTQLLKFSPPELAADLLEDLGYKKREVVSFVVNDADEEKEGSHWSLMIWLLAENKVISFDSANNYNKKATEKLTLTLRSLNERIKFMDFPTPQQANGFDCGLHVLLNLQQFMEHCQKFGYQSKDFVLNVVGVKDLRGKILQIINK